MSKEQKLTVGDNAPNFSFPTAEQTITLEDYRGKWLVLYFFPRVNTPGCTKESCSLRNSNSEINKLGAEIIGISLDSREKQDKFREKHQLPFLLISDADKTISRAYQSLAMFGVASKRKTFIIDPNGKIAHIFAKVTCSNHDEQVLKKLKELI